MLVTFYCETCDAKLRINADAMGSELMCPECETLLRVPEMQLGPGFVVGGFLIKHKLGEGGMGEVYLATQLSLKRDVALKILPRRFTRENSFVVRFLKEVHYQAKLDHPNIVTAYDAGEDNGVYFMAMAYVPGETLEQWLEREGTLSESDALQVIRQVAHALDYASEEKGIIHRDIKPANIMLTPGLHAKVLDMGLSKNTFEKNSTTLADTLMGTPNYISPEQIDHPQDLDCRSDMFSLGMTFYHMLTGQIPFEESGYLKTLHRHAKEKLEDPRDLVPGISAGCVHLLARMLAREPEDRYADWSAFLEDLHRVSAHKQLPRLPEGESTLDVHLPAPPRPPSSSAKTEEPVPAGRSVRGVLFSIGIGLLLGMAGIGVLAKQRGEIPAPAPLPSPTPAFAAAPTPPPEPTAPAPDLSELQSELTGLILDYERTRSGHDGVIQKLLDLAGRAGNSRISESAAEQIIRVRRDRDDAVEAEKDHLRQETVRILYNEGPEPARQYLDQYKSPFLEEMQSQIGNLRRRIRIREQQEQSQREQERMEAEKWFAELKSQLAARVLQREWQQASALVEQAAAEPALFPLGAEVSALQDEVQALQRVPEKILQSYDQKLQQEVVLKLLDRDLAVTILDRRPDGLSVSRTLYAEDGIPVGSAELFIPFSQLSPQEILDQIQRLEGKEILLYKGLLAHRAGERTLSRKYLEQAGTPLALSIRDELFSLPTLDHREFSGPEGEAGIRSPLNTPRFAPLPTIESP